MSRSRRLCLQAGCNTFFFNRAGKALVSATTIASGHSCSSTIRPTHHRTRPNLLLASSRAASDGAHLVRPSDGQWHLSSGYELGQLPLQLLMSVTYQIDGNADSILRKTQCHAKWLFAFVDCDSNTRRGRGPASKMTHLPRLPTPRYPTACPTCSTSSQCCPGPPVTHHPTRKDTAQPICVAHTCLTRAMTALRYAPQHTRPRHCRKRLSPIDSTIARAAKTRSQRAYSARK
eukprot:COSAG02_NODE_1370_length_13018_cov_50.973218_7_plen_232_part_00